MKKRKKAGKAMAGVLGAALFMAAVVPVPAAENPKTDTLELNANVASEYHLTIPSSAAVALTFGEEMTEIGKLKVTGNVKPLETVTVSAQTTPFENINKKGSSFTYKLLNETEEFKKAEWNEEELRKGTKEISLTVNIPSETWYSAAAGDYTSTITFTAELR